MLKEIIRIIKTGKITTRVTQNTDKMKDTVSPEKLTSTECLMFNKLLTAISKYASIKNLRTKLKNKVYEIN